MTIHLSIYPSGAAEEENIALQREVEYRPRPKEQRPFLGWIDNELKAFHGKLIGVVVNGRPFTL